VNYRGTIGFDTLPSLQISAWALFVQDGWISWQSLTESQDFDAIFTEASGRPLDSDLEARFAVVLWWANSLLDDFWGYVKSSSVCYAIQHVSYTVYIYNY
jgi:hypothetical protein